MRHAFVGLPIESCPEVTHFTFFPLCTFLISYSAREEKLFEETLRNRSTSAFYYGTSSGAGNNNTANSGSHSSGGSGPASSSSSSRSSPQSSTTHAGVARRGALAFPARVPVDSGWAVASPSNGDDNGSASAQAMPGEEAAAPAAVLAHGEAVGVNLRSHPIQGRGLPEVRWLLSVNLIVVAVQAS